MPGSLESVLESKDLVSGGCVLVVDTSVVTLVDYRISAFKTRQIPKRSPPPTGRRSRGHYKRRSRTALKTSGWLMLRATDHPDQLRWYFSESTDGE